jgi:uncharacterized damage-inducible protein DinB
MSRNELELIHETWSRQAERVSRVLDALPAGSYEFRPYPYARSIGEMAWHLAEIEAWTTFWIERGGRAGGERPPGAERPREIETLGPRYRRVHADALERASKWTAESIEGEIPYFDGKSHRVGRLIWDAMIHHTMHHLGQLVLMTRLAGGRPPGLYGPNHEDTQSMRSREPERR